ncbi:MAG: hypothetical protein LBU11_08820 [Zoogloeaceae bacterium]|nr:hypothetical protein [Zoogloeaceae bacterium]
MMTRFFWTLAFLALAHAPAWAEGAQANHVTSVKVNGLDVFQAVSMKEWQKAFGAGVTAENAQFMQCTGNYEINVRYPDKNIRLEFFSEDNPDFDMEKILTKKNDAYRKSSLKAQLWIYWEDMAQFKDEVIVEGQIIPAQMTFAEFQKRFPLSAQRKVGDDGLEFVVIFGTIPKDENEETPDDFEAWPYGSALVFGFREGKLFRLTVWSGIAC